MELLVVGAGTMGRWVGRTVDGEVAFADLDRSAAEAAAEAVGGEAVAIDGDRRFDAVCLAVPMSAVEGAIAAQASRAEEAIFDVAGEMETALAAMTEHAPDLERASLHPLFAPENAPGNVAVVVDRGGPTIDAILADLEAAGNDLVETTAEEHDRAMESVQAAAHAAIVAYGLATEDVPDGFSTPVSTALDDLVEQVTAGDTGVYREIQSTFEGATAVAEAADRIAQADPEAIERLFDDADPARGGSDSTLEDADDDADDERDPDDVDDRDQKDDERIVDESDDDEPEGSEDA